MLQVVTGRVASRFSEFFAYFSNWKFNFQKTAVIGSLYHIDQSLENWARSEFAPKGYRWTNVVYPRLLQNGVMEEQYGLFYEEGRFLNYVVQNWSFDKSKLSPEEKADYETAVKRLQEWNQFRQSWEAIENIVAELRKLIQYRKFQMHLPGQQYPQIENEMCTRYKALMDQLKDYPEWQQKVTSQVNVELKSLAWFFKDSPLHTLYNKQEYFK